MYCMKCGAQNDDAARFCIRCGAPLAQAAAAPLPARPRPRPAEPAYPQPAAPSRRGRGLPRWLLTCGVLTLVLVLLCGAAATGVYFWLGLNRTNQTAKIVPADTPLIISFSPDPRQAIYYRDVESLKALAPVFGAAPGLQEAAAEVQADLLTEFDIDWQRDMLPWIGAEASLAMMEAETTGYRDVPPMILAVATRDENKSDAFLQKVRQALERQGAEFDEEVYRDTHVVYVVPDYAGALAPAFATINHLVVVGTDREALHQAIDNAQTKGAPVLTDQEAYQAVLKALPANRLGYLYLDGRTFLGDLEQDVALPLELTALRGIGVSFGLASDGVRLDYVVSYDQSRREVVKHPSHQLKTADLAPDGAMAYWSGQDLLAGWETTLATVADTQDIEELIDEIEYETGVHLVDDVLARLTGEYALVVLPDRAGLWGNDELPLGLLLLAETEETEALGASLGDLTGYLEEQGASLDRQEIEGVSFTLLEDPWEEWALGYGFLDDLLVIGTSPEMLRAAVRGWERPLSANETFQAALKPLPGQANGYFYLDVPEAVRVVYQAMDEYDRESFDRDVRPFLETLRAVSLGMEAMDKEGMAHGTLFLYTGEK